MLMFLGFIVLIACLVIGVRRGGIGLATISGIGLVFFIFVMGLKPGKPPVDVMLTIMAVVTCSAFLQASKGLDVMLKYAEKFLRSNPKYITILDLAACRFMRHRTCSLRYVPYYLRYRYQTKYPPGTADVCCFHCFTNGCLRFACFGSCCFGSCHPRRYRSPFRSYADSFYFHSCYLHRCCDSRPLEHQPRQRS